VQWAVATGTGAVATARFALLRSRDGEVVHVRDYLDALAVRGVAG
jgi:ketosteroid isomerase-like protein